MNPNDIPNCLINVYQLIWWFGNIPHKYLSFFIDYFDLLLDNVTEMLIDSLGAIWYRKASSLSCRGLAANEWLPCFCIIALPRVFHSSEMWKWNLHKVHPFHPSFCYKFGARPYPTRFKNHLYQYFPFSMPCHLLLSRHLPWRPSFRFSTKTP